MRCLSAHNIFWRFGLRCDRKKGLKTSKEPIHGFQKFIWGGYTTGFTDFWTEGFTIFKNAHTFSDSRLKKHKIFIFHLLSNFMEILWKFSANHVQNFQFVVFRIFNKKSGRITYLIFLYLLNIRMSTNELVARLSFLNYRWNF